MKSDTMKSDERLAAHQGKTHKVIIVGLGVTGIAVSHYLSKNNIQHVILEKSAEIGGIWSTQRWPGIRPDTEINSYSYSFKPFISAEPLVPGRTIARYLEEVVEYFQMKDRILFGVAVEKAVFDSQKSLWHIHTNLGRFTSAFLINANGYFSDDPYAPSFVGAENFKGDIVHLSRLNESTRIENKRIILIGSGASAISAAPALCSNCRSLTLLQRSPSYIYEDNNKNGALTRITQTMYQTGISYPMKAITFFTRLRWDLVFVVFRKFPSIGRAFFNRHWKRSVDDKTFKESFQPSYNPWEQRIAVSIGLKDVLRSGKMRVVTGKIKSFAAMGVLLEDGRFIEAEMCILATGYNLRLFKFDLLLDDGKIDTRHINFYKGMMMGGIPNYFQPFGTLHTSWTYRIEMVSRLITKIIVHMEKNKLKTVSVDRKIVPQKPRITPNYIMRCLSELPAVYGTLELPSIDNWFFFSFRKRNYKFSAGTQPHSFPYTLRASSCPAVFLRPN